METNIVVQMSRKLGSGQIRVAVVAHSSDRNKVDGLIDEFRSNGILVWTEENLLPGKERNLAIAEAYREADFILVFLSSDSVNVESGYQRRMKVAAEAAEDMPESGIKLIPVRLDDCRVPSVLSGPRWLDWWEKDAPLKLVLSWAKEWNRRNTQNGWPNKIYQANWE